LRKKRGSHGGTEARSEEVFRLKRKAIVTEHFEDSMKFFEGSLVLAAEQLGTTAL